MGAEGTRADRHDQHPAEEAVSVSQDAAPESGEGELAGRAPEPGDGDLAGHAHPSERTATSPRMYRSGVAPSRPQPKARGRHQSRIGSRHQSRMGSRHRSSAGSPYRTSMASSGRTATATASRH